MIPKPVRLEELPGQSKAEITIAGNADPDSAPAPAWLEQA